MFDTHKLNDDGFVEMKLYKETMAMAVNNVMKLMPECREKSIFLTKLEEGVFFGAKAIAGKTGNHSEITSY